MTNHINRTNHTEFMSYMYAQVKNLADDAGYSGEHHDGGSRALKDTIRAFEAGIRGVYPDTWDKYHKEFIVKSDPEYQKYLELKAKFERMGNIK